MAYYFFGVFCYILHNLNVLKLCKNIIIVQIYICCKQSERPYYQLYAYKSRYTTDLCWINLVYNKEKKMLPICIVVIFSYFFDTPFSSLHRVLTNICSFWAVTDIQKKRAKNLPIKAYNSTTVKSNWSASFCPQIGPTCPDLLKRKGKTYLIKPHKTLS